MTVDAERRRQLAAELLRRNGASGDAETRLRDFVARWRANPMACQGPLNHYDLSWAGRLREGGVPVFPGALEELVRRQRPDGGVGRTGGHPHADLVASLGFANAVGDRWPEARDRAVAHGLRCLDLLGSPAWTRPEAGLGQDYRFPGFPGGWIMPACEAAYLVGTLDPAGEGYDALARLAARAEGSRRAFGPADAPGYEGFFERDDLMLYFGEHFPLEAWRTSAARSHMQRVAAPGLTLASTVRCYEATGDAGARAVLDALVARGAVGYDPANRCLENHFALKYLVAGGAPVGRWLAPECEELAGDLRPDGAAFSRGIRTPDCDCTAVALTLVHGLGLPSPMPTADLEKWWDERRRCWGTAIGHAVFSVSTATTILAATMAAKDVDDARRREVWRRTVAMLEEHPWQDLYHASPYYGWERVVSDLVPFLHRFPDLPTQAPRRALMRILERQEPSGGFGSQLSGGANQEETALALLALKSALRAPTSTFADLRPAITHAATDAERCLLALHRAEGPPARTALWMSKLTYQPSFVSEAIVQGALYQPVATLVAIQEVP